MANELRSLKVPFPPSTGSANLDQWMRDVTGVINAIPLSIFSTTNGPNVSLVTAPQGFFGVEIGSSATKHWLKTSGSTSTGWSLINTSNYTSSSGTWLPSVTSTTNLSAASAYVGQWIRIGNVVTASGRIDVDPTAADVTVLSLTLPVNTAFSSVADAAGVAFAPGIAGQGAALRGIVPGTVAMEWIAVDTSNQSMYYTFTYKVI